MSRVAGVVLALVLTLAAANWPAPAVPDGTTADRVGVDKSDKRMRLYSGTTLLREVRVSFGAQPVGPKQREGDERTPEGVYRLDRANPASMAHRSLHVSYPDAPDRARADSAGVDPGGLIMVHGIRNGLGWLGRLHRLWNWTDGCIAVTNAEMDEIWRVVPVGTEIEIQP